MALLKVHNSTISWFIPSEGNYNDLGEWEEGQGRWEGSIPCDDVPSGGQMSQIVTEDGEMRYYTHTIYIQARYATHDFKYGDKVRITSDSGDSKEFIVKGVTQRQLQTKLWL